LKFPKTPQEVRAALQLDKSDKQLKSKTRSLADLQNLGAGAIVEFETDSTRILNTEQLVAFGQGLSTLEPGIRVEVGGHTDNVGNDDYNLNLSIRRAEAVKYHLVHNYSVNPDVLITRGYGEYSPLNTNSTPQGRQVNRRVEFTRILY
jgi:OOP family OmpA-OmpF porin